MAAERRSRKKKNENDGVQRITSMLSHKAAAEADQSGCPDRWLPSYGDLSALNTSRLLLDSVGVSLLRDIVGDLMDLVGTSCAVYEKNGDYALGFCSSGWCRFMDEASREHCGTPDNRAARESGQGLCRESCWNEAAFRSIDAKEPVDVACRGGIRLFAAPICAGQEIVGGISVGYGDPPRDPARLRELASVYGVRVKGLREQAEAYAQRPPFIIELAKKRVLSSARLMGELVQRKQAEATMRKNEEKLRSLVETTSDWIWEVDQTGLYTYTNPKIRDLLGYEPEEVLGKTPFDFMPPAERERAARLFQETVQSKASLNAILNTNIHKSGRKVTLETSAVPILGVNGTLLGYRGIDRDVTERRLAEVRVAQLNSLKEQLLGRGALNEKLGTITEAAVKIYDADFARIWISKEGDLCEKGCSHVHVAEGPHACRDRSRCLHLVASSGRYTHLDGNHRRVPLGAYKIGNIASGRDAFFLTNDVIHDPSIHSREWAEALGLVSFAGFRLISPDAIPIGVLALFKKQPITPQEMRSLEDLANTTSQVIRAGAAEEALRENENRFRSLVLNSSDTITVLADDGIITYQSPSLKRFFGYEPEDLVGKNAFPHVHPHDLATAQAAFSRILEHPGTPVTLEYRFRHANGSWIFVESVGSSFLDDPSIKGVVLNSRDVSERKQVEERLRTASLYARSLLEASLDPLVTISPQGKITDVNQATEQVTGVAREHLIGDDFSNYFTEPEKAREGYQKVLEDGSVRDYPLTIQHTSGKTTDVLYNATVYRNERGAMQGVFAAARDITKRKQAERALEESSQKLKFFAYSVAHDLKSPAIGVYGLTKRLSKHARDVLDERGRTYCDQILKVSEHIAALVDKINVYIATKEARLSIETIDIADILHILEEEFSAQLAIRQIEWLKPDIRVEVKADRLCMLRAFRNFVDNSLKYGGERLSKIWTGYEEAEGFHIISFSDNGKGLKEADSEKIFGAFQRNETSRGVEGAGLGLTIVKEIAEQHGGEVWVEPRSKKGITFYLSISKKLT